MQSFEPNEVALANEIAEQLDDKDSVALFLTYCRKYKESFLKDMVKMVLAIPERKIKKTRGALFVFLVNQHGTSRGLRT